MGLLGFAVSIYRRRVLANSSFGSNRRGLSFYRSTQPTGYRRLKLNRRPTAYSTEDSTGNQQPNVSAQNPVRLECRSHLGFLIGCFFAYAAKPNLPGLGGEFLDYLGFYSPMCCEMRTRSKMLTMPSLLRSGELFPKREAMKVRSKMLMIPSALTSHGV